MANLGDPISTIAYPDIGFPGGGGTIAFDPLSSYVLAARNGRFSVCDTQSGTLNWHIQDSPGVVVGGTASPDSSSVALVWGPLTAMRFRILDLADGSETFSTGPGLFGNAEFSPDGKLLAYLDASVSGTTTATIVAVPAATGTPVTWTAPGPAWSAGGVGRQSPVVFSPDARFIGYRKGNDVVLLDAESGHPTGLTAPSPGPWTFTADARALVTFGWQAGRWPVITFNDLDTGLALGQIELVFPALPPANGLDWTTATFTRDARRIAVKGQNSFAIFDLPSPPGDPVQTHPLFTPPTFDLAASPTFAFSAGGHLLKVAQALPDGDDQLRIVDAATGATKWQRDSSGGMGSVFSPGGRYLAVWGSGNYADDDGQQHAWTGAEVLTADDTYQAADAGFAGRLASQTHFDTALDLVGVTGGATPLVVAVTAADPATDTDPTLAMLRPADAKPVRTVPVPGTVTAIASAPDAPWVALGSGAGLLRVLHSDRDGQDWQARHGSLVNAVAVAVTGRLIATASSDQRGRVFTAIPAPGDNLADRPPLWSTTKHPQSVIRVAISADERWVVTGCADGALRIFENSDDPADHPPRHTLPSASRLRVLTLGGTQTGAAGYADGSAVVFDLDSGDAVPTFWHSAPLLSVSLNSTATLLATATAAPDSQLRVFSVSSDSTDPVLAVDYHGVIADVAASPAAPILATALASGSVAILNTDNGSDWIRLPLGAPVRNVAFNADGTMMVAASDRLLHIYDTT